MNITELLGLTTWITKNISDTGIPKRYKALYSVLQANTQPGQQKQPFESQKDDLISSLRSVPLEQLTRDQHDFLAYLGIADAVGDTSANSLEDVLFRNAIDVANAAKKVQQIFEQLNAGIAKSSSIQSNFSDYATDEQYQLENAVLMRIGFKGQAHLSNVADFKKWGSTWFDIGRGLAMAHDATPEDIRIVGATKGSIVLELIIASAIATTVSGAILAALKVAEKVMDIRKKAEEIRSLKLANDKIAKELESVADKEMEDGIDAIGKEIVKKLGIQVKGDGEKVKALETAVKNLVGFIEKGGDIDFVLPTNDGNGEEHGTNRELRVAFEEIRRIEQKIALIEFKGE